jgi:glycine betaine/choline ABC-type transport system substrate-binding protein
VHLRASAAEIPCGLKVSSGRASDAHLYVHAGSGQHVHQAIEAEQIDLATHQVGDFACSFGQQQPLKSGDRHDGRRAAREQLP